MSSLFPRGISHMADLPYPFFNAIRSGLAFLSFEELPKDERPPRDIWLDGDAMAAWWARVERERERKYSGDKSGPEEESGLADDLIVG